MRAGRRRARNSWPEVGDLRSCDPGQLPDAFPRAITISPIAHVQCHPSMIPRFNVQSILSCFLWHFSTLSNQVVQVSGLGGGVLQAAETTHHTKGLFQCSHITIKVIWRRSKFNFVTQMQIQFLLIQVTIRTLELGAESTIVFTIFFTLWSIHKDWMKVQWSGAVACCRCNIEANTSPRSVTRVTPGTLMTIPRPTGDRSVLTVV